MNKIYYEELYFDIVKEGKNFFLIIGNKDTKNENLKIINEEVREFRHRNEMIETKKVFQKDAKEIKDEMELKKKYSEYLNKKQKDYKKKRNEKKLKGIIYTDYIKEN